MTKRFLSPIKLANIASDPTGSTGALYYNSGSNVLKYYNGSAWVALSSSSTAALFWVYLATGGETVLSGLDTLSQTLAYTAGAEQVFLNGILLIRGQDYTATNGTSITLSSALSNGWKLLCDPVFVGDKRAQGANTWAGPHFLFVFQKENDPVHVAQSSEQ